MCPLYIFISFRVRFKRKGVCIPSFLPKWLAALKTYGTRIAFFVQYYVKKTLFKSKIRLPAFRKAHLNAFPAVHLKKVDGVDLVVKFSSELLVAGLAIFVAILNIFFFKVGVHQNYNDGSYAFSFLSNHIALNTKYYGKQTSISTVVVNNNGLIAQARANDFEGISNQPQTLAEDSTGSAIVTNNSLVQQNPDSIKQLVAKQIKIYTTKSGDSLQSIAAANNISVQTILDTNNLLNGTVIKPGWQLIILPTDGVLYTATSNDTLPDVAKKFSGDLNTIISYNGLADAEDIDAGQLIIVPGGHKTPPPVAVKPTVKPKVATDKTKVGGSAPIETVPDNDSVFDIAGGHTFPAGYCTWYVAQKLHGLVKWGGDAKYWITNSKAFGAVTDQDPAPGTIVVTNENRQHGHVAYVEKVTDHSIVVSEMNFSHFGKVDTREIPLTSSVIRGFIHP